MKPKFVSLVGSATLFVTSSLPAQTEQTELEIFHAAELVFNTTSNTLYQIKTKQPTLFEAWSNSPSPFIGTNSEVAFLISTRDRGSEFFQVLKLAPSDLPAGVLYYAPFNGSTDAYRIAPLQALPSNDNTAAFGSDKWQYDSAVRLFPTNTFFATSGIQLVGSELSVFFRMKVSHNSAHQGVEPVFLAHTSFEFSLQQPSSDAAQLFASIRLEGTAARIYGMIPYDEWVDILATHKRPYSRLYANGVLIMEKETNADTFDGASMVYFGQPRTFSGGTHYLTDFALDDVLVFEHELTPIEATGLRDFKF